MFRATDSHVDHVAAGGAEGPGPGGFVETATRMPLPFCTERETTTICRLELGEQKKSETEMASTLDLSEGGKILRTDRGT